MIEAPIPPRNHFDHGVAPAGIRCPVTPFLALRVWAGLALLSGAWLLGLSYYQQAWWPGWAGLVAAGTLLLSGTLRRMPGRSEAALVVLLFLPAVWFAPWPYRTGPALIAGGAALGLAPIPRRWPRSLASGMLAGGVILLAQGLGVLVYAALTARSHELPVPLANLLVGAARLLGIDAALATHSGRDIALASMRQTHPLGATWELLFDPPSFCFLIGGFCLLAMQAMSNRPAGRNGCGWIGSCGTLLVCVLCWLPIRSGLLLGVYLHRALRTDYDSPLNLMNQFWSPWVHLVLLTGPVLLAQRFVRGTHIPAVHESEEPQDRSLPFAVAPLRRRALALSTFALAIAAFTAAILWDPPGERKSGRVLVDEYHSDWEPTEKPFDTKWYGNPSGYNYYCIYDYCSRFFNMGRIVTPIDDRVLSGCDVLVLKVPDAQAYAAEEVAAIRGFVERGGGLLLIGEHTDVFKTGVHLNTVAREFGFRFRPDCLFGIESFFEQRYAPGRVPHPIVQRVPPMDFAVSCSIDPCPGTLDLLSAFSSGRAAIFSTGLKNRLADYHAGNFYPQAEDDPQMRYGAFVQLWTTRYGRGRVAAYTDSTQFSNFCAFDPGKSEMLTGMIEWLNRASPRMNPRPALSGLGLILLAASLWAARPVRNTWLPLLAAGALGGCLSAEAIHAAQRAAMPAPPQLRPMTRVVIDRTVSRAHLPTNGFIAGKPGEFGIFERWILRLGYFIARASGPEVFKGDLVVFLHPGETVSRKFRDALAKYVENGGKILILDSPENARSTANSLLYPYGLKLSLPFMDTLQGRIETTGGLPAVNVESAYEVSGGVPLARLGGKPVAATATHGKGSVTVIGFGSRFTDINMGVTGDAIPDDLLRQVYDLQFSLLRSIVEGRPATRPATQPH